MKNASINISTTSLSQEGCYDFVKTAATGGIVVFVGTVRNDTNGRKVNQLAFSCYKPMAVKEMEKIAHQALNQFDIQKIAIHHAEGMLQIGDIPVIIAVSAKHRKAAFDACEYAIDTLKETVSYLEKRIF